MLQFEPFDDTSWKTFCEQVDEVILRTSDAYINLLESGGCGLTFDDLAGALGELYRLRQGNDPNYDLPCVPLAYAFTYLPRKAALIAALLDEAVRHGFTNYRRVLDIGGGSGATLIAMHVISPYSKLLYANIDPSTMMQKYASCIASDKFIERSHLYTGLQDFFSPDALAAIGHADLIFMSSVFPNKVTKWDRGTWRDYASHVLYCATRGTIIFHIEPRVKRDVTEAFRQGMMDSGVKFEAFPMSYQLLLPKVSRKATPLRQCTQRLQLWFSEIDEPAKLSNTGRSMVARIGSSTIYDVTCWNTHANYDETGYMYII